MTRKVANFILVNAAFLALTWSAVVFGLTRDIKIKDETYVSWLIATIFLIGLIVAIKAIFDPNQWKNVRWLANSLVFLGLIGTVLGFIVALSSIDPEQSTDIDKVRETIGFLVAGMGTALQTTLIGSVGYLWLSAVAFVTDGEDI